MTTTPKFSGGKIVEIRSRIGLRQDELARRAGVHVAQLSRWERGHATPLASAVGVLAGALGVEVGELFVVDGDGEDEDEDDQLLEAAHALDRAGQHDLAGVLRDRAIRAKRGRTMAEARRERSR